MYSHIHADMLLRGISAILSLLWRAAAEGLGNLHVPQMYCPAALIQCWFVQASLQAASIGQQCPDIQASCSNWLDSVDITSLSGDQARIQS